MYPQRRAVERIVTREVMRLERRLAIERGDIIAARPTDGGSGSDRDLPGRPAPRPSSR
jgi:hypothetical protein